MFDNEDIYRKIEGPVVIEDLTEASLPKPDDRLLSLAMVGPDAPALLRQLKVPELADGQMWHGDLAGVTVTIANLGYGVGDVRYEVLVHPNQAEDMWARLMEAGAVPRGAALRVSLHARAGLPDYTSERPSASELYEGPHRTWFRVGKPYFVGRGSLRPSSVGAHKTDFIWQPPDEAPLRRTPLYEAHRQLTGKVIPFAGWEMPVWYTSVSDEHQAVRTGAGLFDVAHMGVLDVCGEHAAGFMDVVASNYARWIDPGQSIYAYLLTPHGEVIDDIIMYRLAWDRYLLVVNAVNAEKDLAWLQAVNSKKYILDHVNPGVETEGEVTIRDLKDPASGTDQRVDLALQGPSSLAVLHALTDDVAVRRQLSRIRRTEHARLQLASIDLIAARTGYTGEEVGFELLVHPQQAPRLWNLLLEKGAPLGTKPCGLAARDSTRIEAGLPLYGHELAGEYHITPSEAGFSAYVKLHKPFFVGRRHALESELGRSREVVRFRVNESGTRALRPGDPVVNKRGQYIGRVTSCTLVGGRQLGLAIVEKRYNQPNTEIGVFPMPLDKGQAVKALGDLALGDAVPLSIWATVLPRFPQNEAKTSWSVSSE